MPERQIIRETIESIDAAFDQAGKTLSIKYYGWEMLAPEATTGTPQDVIDSRMPWIDCDLVIGLLWKKFGSQDRSGQTPTEREVRRAYELFKE